MVLQEMVRYLQQDGHLEGQGGGMVSPPPKLDQLILLLQQSQVFIPAGKRFLSTLRHTRRNSLRLHPRCQQPNKPLPCAMLNSQSVMVKHRFASDASKSQDKKKV